MANAWHGVFDFVGFIITSPIEEIIEKTAVAIFVLLLAIFIIVFVKFSARLLILCFTLCIIFLHSLRKKIVGGG